MHCIRWLMLCFFLWEAIAAPVMPQEGYVQISLSKHSSIIKSDGTFHEQEAIEHALAIREYGTLCLCTPTICVHGAVFLSFSKYVKGAQNYEHNTGAKEFGSVRRGYPLGFRYLTHSTNLHVRAPFNLILTTAFIVVRAKIYRLQTITPYGLVRSR
jgi:hypothetical protein